MCRGSRSYLRCVAQVWEHARGVLYRRSLRGATIEPQWARSTLADWRSRQPTSATDSGCPIDAKYIVLEFASKDANPSSPAKGAVVRAPVGCETADPERFHIEKSQKKPRNNLIYMDLQRPEHRLSITAAA